VTLDSASAARPRVALVLAVIAGTAAACAGARAPRPGASEFVRGQLQHVVKGSADHLWPTVVAALEDESLAVERSDRERGLIACRRVRYVGERDAPRRLREIADTSEAVRRGLRNVAEYSVEYTLYLSPAGDDTAFKIASAIQATDRSQAIYFGGGLYQVVPETYDLPSRGVVEGELFRRIAGRLFAAEEMLYYVGDLGYD
jgi:hypothetical protein